MAEQEETGQRTEEATPRRREEAREKGQVAISAEMMSAVGLLAGFAVLALGGGALAEAIGGTLTQSLGGMSSLAREELSSPHAALIVREAITGVLGALLLVTIPGVLAAGLAGYLQVGLRFASKAVELDPNKLNPIRGLKRLFSLRSAVRTGLSAAKVLLITLTVAVVAWLHFDDIVRMGTSELGPLLLALGHVAMRCAIAALLVTLFLAGLDVLYQRAQHDRDLRMTKHELKEEQRLTDGDPHVRARIRAIQRELATRRMMEDVPSSTVVVTNPTHYAVALRYDRDAPQHSAPVVVAKGVDHVAQKIKELARDNGVVCYEDVALARALYAQVEIGQEIPEELYSAVATVLGYVYRLQGASV